MPEVLEIFIKQSCNLKNLHPERKLKDKLALKLACFLFVFNFRIFELKNKVEARLSPITRTVSGRRTCFKPCSERPTQLNSTS